MVSILSFDPGRSKKSFAYSYAIDGRVVNYGLVEPIAALTGEAQLEIRNFADRIASMLLWPLDYVVAERFMSRGASGKGLTGEAVNIMIGTILTMSGYPTKLVMPATWKNWLTRHYQIGKKAPTPNMLSALQSLKPEIVGRKGAPKMSVHEGDAIAIGFWWDGQLSRKLPDIKQLIDENSVKIDV